VRERSAAQRVLPRERYASEIIRAIYDEHAAVHFMPLFDALHLRRDALERAVNMRCDSS